MQATVTNNIEEAAKAFAAGRIVLGAFEGSKLVDFVKFDKESDMRAMKSHLETNYPGCVIRRKTA